MALKGRTALQIGGFVKLIYFCPHIPEKMRVARVVC